MADEETITEFEKMEAERVDGVPAAANGAEFLFMKSMDDGDADDEKDDGKDYGDDDDADDDKSMKGAFCGDEGCEVCQFRFGGDMEKAKLDAKSRNALPESSFALQGRRYPIHDKAHARNALSRVAQNGTPAEKRKVRGAVARKFPGIGKPKKAAKNMHTGSMGQTEAVHGDRMGAKHMQTQREEGIPNRPDAGSPNGEHDGRGDTAPDKNLDREGQLSQTRANMRKSESPGAERPAARSDVDLGGDRAGSGDDAAAESKARSQTSKVERHQTGGGISAESSRMMNYARTGAYKSAAGEQATQALLSYAQSTVAALTESEQREISFSTKQLRQARQLLKALAKSQGMPHPTQEIEKMNQEELVALLDKRDAMKAKALKAARKAKKAKDEKKAAKATKSAKNPTQAVEEAAGAAKSAPVVDVDGIVTSLGEAIKAQLEPLAKRVAQVEKEDSRSRPRPAISDLAGAAPVQRGDMSKEQASQGLEGMQKAFDEERDPEKKAKLGTQLTTARLVIQERLRHGKPA